MSLQVDIVTPTQTAFSGQASEVQAPGFVGEFGVMPDHALFLSVVRAGVVTIYQDGETERFVVGPGFVEAGPDRITLLTEVCEPAEGVDVEGAKALLESAEKALASADPASADWLKADRDSQLARARLSL